MAEGGKFNTDNLSDEILNVLCSMCKHQDRNTEGEKFCLECEDYFCAKCVDIHNKVPLCARHNMLDKDQAKLDKGHVKLDKGHVKLRSSRFLVKAPTEICDRHSHKHIDMYCLYHDNVGCSTCMEIDHKSCDETFYIPDFLQDNIHKMAPEKIQTKLEMIAKTLTEQTGKYKQDKQKLLKRKAELVADIKKFRQEINHQLDKLEKKSVDEIERQLKILEDKIEESLKQLQANKARVTAANNKLTSPCPNLGEEFVHVKMAEEAAHIATKCIEDHKTHVQLVNIGFNPAKDIITQLKERENLGILNNLLNIKGEKSYCIKTESDKKICYITSACYMEDSTVILADTNNRKLKWLDSVNYTVKDYCDLPGDPWQVCSITNSQLAVTLPSEGIQFISLERPMKLTNKIKTDFICYGLAYASNNLYISDTETVYIYTLSGSKVRQFSNNASRPDLFSEIRFLAVGEDGSRIFVADDSKGLIVLDNNGQVVSTFSGENLQRACCCCCVTESGSVLVSGFNDNDVLQFTHNGELMGEVVNDKEGVWAVCCNQQMSRMCISLFGGDNILVYDI